jgi:hypothetical protein
MRQPFLARWKTVSPKATAARIVVGALCLAGLLGTVGVRLGAQLPLGSSAAVLASFQMSELFGTSWPDQPIEFRYDGGRPPEHTTRMILEPAGIEVPYQWVSSCSDATATKGCIVVRSALPANARYTWTLQSGPPPAARIQNPVKLSQQGQNYEMTNGLTGIRIATPASNPRPWNRAPIQGILLPGDIWTGAGSSPNRLYAESQADAGNAVGKRRTPMYTVNGYDVSIVDSGPLKTVLKATYAFQRPRYYYGAKTINTAGTGHYTLIVTMYANSKSILIDEDSDMQFSYYLPLYAQLMPDEARYRGHDGYGGPICGYEAAVPVNAATNASPIAITASYGLSNGQEVLINGVQGNLAANGKFYGKTSGYPPGQFGLYLDAALLTPAVGSGIYTGAGILKPSYRGWELHPAHDAYLDITYTGDRPASFECSANTYRKLISTNPPADLSAGWYLEMYQSASGPPGPVVGIYTGTVSKLVNSALGPSMPGIYSSNRHWVSETKDAGIQVDNWLIGPDQRTGTVVHRNWAIWVSTQADLLSPAAHQPIADDQNSLSSINLSHLFTYQLTYPDPPGGWQWLYLEPAAAQQLIGWIRNGTSKCGSVNCYYELLRNSDPTADGRALLNIWQGDSTAAIQTGLNVAISLAKAITDNLATGDNRWYQPFESYQIGLYTTPLSPLLNGILMDIHSTTSQKSMAKAMLALFGCLFWDDDWTPIDDRSKGGLGLSDQYEMYFQFRTHAVAAAPSNPYLALKLPTAISYTTNEFKEYFSPTGAAAASTHYQSAFLVPLLLNYQALSLDGYLSMKDPKWAAYANWELSILTPPEPRFGNIRKVYSNGDGNTESTARPGMLAAALNGVNPGLASNLMWAWQQSNRSDLLTEEPYSSSLAFINPTIPAVMPQLGSINIPGYHSVERHGFGTPHETVTWFINGNFYSTGGHRHNDDGQVSIYAHSAPLAIDWNANLYNPNTGGRFMHNSIVFDSELKHPWSADNASLADAYTLMKNPTNTEFGAFGNSTTATANFTAADGTVWTRLVRTMVFNPSYPIIYVTDKFAGPGAAAGKTLTWNLMADGRVSTPAGWITPVSRFSPGCQNPAGALPSNGPVNPLSSGLQAFGFTGTDWPRHATRGIDWDLFTLSNTATQQFFIGNWGHGCHPEREQAEYKAANGTPFRESQHILRIHDTGPFTTIILPFRKTEPPARAVTQQNCGVQIVQDAQTTCFNDSVAVYSNGTTHILTVYDNSTQSAFGVSVSGGPQEVIMQPGQVRWTMSGISLAARSLNLSGSWHPSQNVTKNGNTFTYAYQGGAQAAPVTIVFEQ